MIGNTVPNQKKQRVLVSFLQDRSGSMNSNWSETLNGFKVFVKDLQSDAVEVDYSFSLTTFDTLIDKPYQATPIAQVDPDILAGFGPRGGTSLYDAMGATIEDITRLANDFDKIIMVIVTDGGENTSRAFNKDKIHTLVDECLKTDRWTFQYLGTQPETWGDAGNIGLGVGSTMTFSNIGAQGAAAYNVTSDGIKNFSKSAFTSTNNLGSRYAGAAMREAACMVSVDDGTADKIASDVKITTTTAGPDQG